MNIKKVKEIRKDICSGCLTYEFIDEEMTCKIPHKINGHPCPCSTCIVKMTCHDASCDDIRFYIKKARKQKLMKRKIHSLY
jgi:hypothetical protein